MAEFLAIARDFDGVTAADGPPIPIILKAGERMLASVSGATLIEPRKGPGHWEGRSHGVSVHVPGTRSMRYRLGASHGTFVQGVEHPAVVDVGTFTLTTARAVFTGSKQTREWAWSKLISVTHAADADWTMLAVSNRQKVSGIGYDAAHAERCRFWIDFAVARATGSLPQLVESLERELAALAPPPPPGAPPPATAPRHRPPDDRGQRGVRSCSRLASVRSPVGHIPRSTMPPCRPEATSSRCAPSTSTAAAPAP